MRCPTLIELPSPPSGKHGFPWTEESLQLPETMPDGTPWVSVSVVTPSYNQAEFLEETLRSILLQGYPNLELIVVDGGSTDGSVDIIRKYAPWLAAWSSKPDKGQVYAVDRGWRQSSGEILAYLNSDDTYLPNAIGRAAIGLAAHPDAAAICGSELWIDREGIVISERPTPSITFPSLLFLNFVPQPAIFLRRRAFDQAGGLNVEFHHSFDYELWTRLVRCGGIAVTPDLLATTRWHTDVKRLKLGPAIASEVKRAVYQALNTPEGKRLSPGQRRTMRAQVHFLAASIYLDRFPRFLDRAVIDIIAALFNRPLFLKRISSLIFSNIYSRAAVVYNRVWKHKIIQRSGPPPAETGILWNQWPSRKQPAVAGSLNEIRTQVR